MVTAGTYRKGRYFKTRDRLQLLHDTLLELAAQLGWRLQAWAVLANHYHFLAIAPENPRSLRAFVSKLHTVTARRANQMDDAAGRKVWFQYWDSHIPYPRSYLARLNYVQNNPVHHGVVEVAREYPWCSAAWFERTADPVFQKTVATFQTGRIKVVDDF